MRRAFWAYIFFKHALILLVLAFQVRTSQHGLPDRTDTRYMNPRHGAKLKKSLEEFLLSEVAMESQVSWGCCCYSNYVSDFPKTPQGNGISVYGIDSVLLGIKKNPAGRLCFAGISF